MRLGIRIFSDDRMGLIDYVLAGMAGIMATFSVGMALIKPTLGLFFLAGISVGMTASFYLQRAFRGQKWLEAGSFLYFLVAMVAVFYSSKLNGILPEGGFGERELTVASVLAWMILLGSFVAWKDSTLLFQAVPSIALFGLVGAFDTFEGSTVAFFIFLLCLATLFARAHARSMLKLAMESGYGMVDRIRQGPWRWMAGPEWALASAAVVILISVFSAPILQESVKGVSGIVKIPIPRLPRSQNQPAPVAAGIPGLAGSSFSTVSVGTGPQDIGNRVVFWAKLDRPRYLRSGSYSTYERGTWNKVPVDQTVVEQRTAQTMADRQAFIEGPNAERIPFGIEFNGMPLTTLPAPGEVISVKEMPIQHQLDGGTGFGQTATLNSKFSGEAAVLKSGIEPESVPQPLPEMLWQYATTNNNPEGVNDLSDRVTATAATDYEKAIAIQREIERRCKYNLKAEAPPRGVDPIRNFLFGKEKEGYCDLFASAMVVMARWQQIPARYVRGYYPLNPDRDGDGWYAITENCAHAWAELYFEGVGWVVFDPTEGAEAVEGGGRGELNDTSPFYKREWFAMFLNALIGLSIVGAGLAAYRGARKVHGSIDWAQIEMARQYEQFTAALQKASGQPKRPSQTATEYVASVSGALGEAREEAARVNDLFVLALYGPPTADRPGPDELKGPVQEIRRTLKTVRRRT